MYPGGLLLRHHRGTWALHLGCLWDYTFKESLLLIRRQWVVLAPYICIKSWYNNSQLSIRRELMTPIAITLSQCGQLVLKMVRHLTFWLSFRSFIVRAHSNLGLTKKSLLATQKATSEFGTLTRQAGTLLQGNATIRPPLPILWVSLRCWISSIQQRWIKWIFSFFSYFVIL